MIHKYQRQNVQVLIEQKFQPIMMIIEAYQSGEDVSEALDNWKGYGTTGEAINEYLKNNVEQKPKRKRTAKKAGE